MAFIPVHKLAKSYQALQSRVERSKEKAEETVGEVVKLVEVAGSCAAMSYANAYYGKAPANPPAGSVGLFEIDVVGVPADLALGGALEVLTLMGFLGKQKEHGYNIGAGLVACYGARMGTQMGQHALTQKNVNNVKTSAGSLGYGPYSSYNGTQARNQAWAAQHASAGVG